MVAIRRLRYNLHLHLQYNITKGKVSGIHISFDCVCVTYHAMMMIYDRRIKIQQSSAPHTHTHTSCSALVPILRYDYFSLLLLLLCCHCCCLIFHPVVRFGRLYFPLVWDEFISCVCLALGRPAPKTTTTTTTRSEFKFSLDSFYTLLRLRSSVFGVLDGEIHGSHAPLPPPHAWTWCIYHRIEQQTDDKFLL